MAERKGWIITGRLDAAGDPIFRAEDGGLWAVSRSVGTVAQILERLQSGPAIPWSQLERVGHDQDWVVGLRWEGAAGQWSEVLQWAADQLRPLGEDVLYHDWERGEGFVFRSRLSEERAKTLAAALQGRDGAVATACPVLAHLQQGA